MMLNQLTKRLEQFSEKVLSRSRPPMNRGARPPERGHAKGRFEFNAAGDRRAEILIYGEIGEYWGGPSAVEFIEMLNSLGPLDELVVRINSRGGDLFVGIAIYNAIARYPARTTCVIDGLAYSCGSVIAMAADEGLLQIADNGRLGIHEVWTIAVGNAGELRKVADEIEVATEIIADIYRKRTARTGGASREQLLEWMDADTTLTAQQALEAGLVDEVVDMTNLAGSDGDAQSAAVRNRPSERAADRHHAEEAACVAVRLRMMELEEHQRAA